MASRDDEMTSSRASAMPEEGSTSQATKFDESMEMYIAKVAHHSRDICPWCGLKYMSSYGLDYFCIRHIYGKPFDSVCSIVAFAPRHPCVLQVGSMLGSMQDLMGNVDNLVVQNKPLLKAKADNFIALSSCL